MCPGLLQTRQKKQKKYYYYQFYLCATPLKSSSSGKPSLQKQGQIKLLYQDKKNISKKTFSVTLAAYHYYLLNLLLPSNVISLYGENAPKSVSHLTKQVLMNFSTLFTLEVQVFGCGGHLNPVFFLARQTNGLQKSFTKTYLARHLIIDVLIHQKNFEYT